METMPGGRESETRGGKQGWQSQENLKLRGGLTMTKADGGKELKIWMTSFIHIILNNFICICFSILNMS